MNPDLAMRHTSPFKQRCNLCGRIQNFFYPAIIGGQSFKFCSGMHLHQAQKNYEKNKNTVFPSQTTEEPINDYEEGINNE